MLPQHHSVFAPDLNRIEALIIDRILDESIDMDAGFVSKHRLADDAFVERHAAAGGTSDQRGEGGKMPRIDAAFDIVEMPQGHHGFLQGCVTGTLAQAIDGGADMGGAGTDGGQRVGGGEPEVIVRMHFYFHIHGFAQ